MTDIATATPAATAESAGTQADSPKDDQHKGIGSCFGEKA